MNPSEHVKDIYMKTQKVWRSKLQKKKKTERPLIGHESDDKIVKLAIIPKANHRFSPIPIKIPNAYFIEIEKKP